MKKFVSALVAVAAVAVALPAAAQPYGHGPGYGDRGVYSEIQQLDNRVDRSCARRVLSRSECRRLEGQVDYLKATYRNYMRGGLTRWERQDLQNRIYRVQAMLRHERRDDDRRDGRWDDRGDYGRGRH